MHSFQRKSAFGWCAKGWVIFSIYSVEREIHYRMENGAYFKNVQRSATKKKDTLKAIMILSSGFFPQV